MNGNHETSITKLTAAQRQLDCAIRLFFEDDDSLSVYTLAHAAFKLLYDLYPKRRSDTFFDHLNNLIGGFGWRQFNHVPNFLKHADNDPDGILRDHSADAVKTTLGLATLLYKRITGVMTAEMRAFEMWMRVMYPDKFELPMDPDPDFEKVYRDSLAVLNRGPRETPLLLGKSLIKLYRDRPELNK